MPRRHTSKKRSVLPGYGLRFQKVMGFEDDSAGFSELKQKLRDIALLYYDPTESTASAGFDSKAFAKEITDRYHGFSHEELGTERLYHVHHYIVHWLGHVRRRSVLTALRNKESIQGTDYMEQETQRKTRNTAASARAQQKGGLGSTSPDRVNNITNGSRTRVTGASPAVRAQRPIIPSRTRNVRPSCRMSGTAVTADSAILAFLNGCRPPMPHLLSIFLELGFDNKSWLTSVASWPKDQLLNFLKDLVAEEKFSRLEIEVLRVRFLEIVSNDV